MSEHLDKIDEACGDIRRTVANADMSDKDGRYDLVRDLGILVECIEGHVQRIREEHGMS